MMDFWYHLFPILGFIGYFLAACGYIMQLFQTPPIRIQTARGLLLFGFCNHLIFLLLDGIGSTTVGSGWFTREMLLPSFALTLSKIACTAVGCFLLFERRFGLSFLGVLLAPLAVVLMLLSAFLFHMDRAGLEPFANSGFLWLHISFTILGHTGFLLAFGVSAALIVQESLLKSRKFSSIQRRLPPLAVLDRLNARLLGGGFLMMSLGVLLGFVFGGPQVFLEMHSSTRVFWSCVTLAVYAVLLLAIMVKGYRGRRAAWLSVAGFCTVILSFISSNAAGSGFHVH